MRNITIVLGLILSIVFGSEKHLKAQNAEQHYLMKFIAAWGQKGQGPGEFSEPQAISVDPSGYLYIADTQNHRIQRFDSNGNFISEKGGFGWEPEQFNEPVALSTRNGLDVFVADYNNSRIVRYDKDLNFISFFSSRENEYEDYQFGFPSGVDLSTHGELFCLDRENNRILKWDGQGNPQISFGDFDAGEGRLVEPQKLLVTPSGNVMVSDTEPGRIVVYDIHGNFIFVFGEGLLEKPAGMTCTDAGILWICDTELQTMFLFKESGEPLGRSQKPLILDAQWEEPVDVAFWKKKIYILDKKKSCVLVFQWQINHEIESE
jgi:sugar lactone lactonase YvrE